MYKKLQEKVQPSNSISQTQMALMRLFEADVADKTDYDDPTLRLLLRIRMAPDGEIRAKDISKGMRKSTSHISRLVERAAKKDLLERRVDPSDRRAQKLTLTQKGEEVIDSYVPHALALLEEVVFETLSTEEISQLMSLLNRLEAKAKELLSERKKS